MKGRREGNKTECDEMVAKVNGQMRDKVELTKKVELRTRQC